MATPQGAVTSLRSGLLGDSPGRAGRRSCHRARGTRTPGRCAPGAAPLGHRLRSRRETPCAPWGARPNARGRCRVAGDRRCSRGVRSSAGAGRSVDAGAGKRRARRGSAEVPASDPRGPQAPAARGAEAGAAAGMVSRFREGSLTATRRRRGERPRPVTLRTPPSHQSTHAFAGNALIHIAPRTHPPSLPSSFLRIHRISFSASLLHITHTCTYWCAGPSCVTKRPRCARQAQITPRAASVNLSAAVGSGWQGSCIGWVGPQARLGRDRVDILGQGRATPSERLSREGPGSEGGASPLPMAAADQSRTTSSD